MRLIFVIVCLFISSILSDIGAQQRAKSLSDEATFFEKFLPAGRIVSAELKGNKLLYSSAGSHEPHGVATEDVLFEIGSTSKIFTGLLLAQAVVERRISLDSRITDLLPNQTFADERVGKIALRQLATHTSGLPSHANDFRDGADPSDPWVHYDRPRFMAWLGRVQLEGDNPFGISYSNFGMALLGELLAGVYQMKWEDLIRVKITQPLKMNDTVVTLNREQQRRLATPNMGTETVKSMNFLVLVGAGGLRSTASDMITFGRALIAPEQTPLKDAIEMLLAPQNKDESMGLAIAKYKSSTGARALGHDGGTTGYRCVFEVLPKEKAVNVILINNSLMDGRVLIQRMSGEKTRYERTETVLEKEKLTDYEGIYSVTTMLPDHIKNGEFILEVKNGQLIGKLLGTPFSEPSLRLCPDAQPDRFFLRELPAHYQFSRKDGQVISLSYVQSGFKLDAKRNIQSEPSPSSP